MHRHLFFDLDGTLTRSRSLIEREMKEVLQKLPQDIIIVSGAELAQINKQVEDARVDFKLGQNGNHAHSGDGKVVLWENNFSPSERAEIMKHISFYEEVRDWEVKDVNDLVEDRGSQITYSCLGHHEDVSKKEKFDPDGSIRVELIQKNIYPLTVAEAKAAGTTSIDYFKKNAHKGTNVLKLIEVRGWKKEECLYFGDSLYPGGNDESVIGVIDTQEVANEHETLRLLKEKHLG